MEVSRANNFRTWYLWSMFFFIIAGTLGVTMRLAFVIDIPEWIDYRNITHAHSHIAMMGWLYCALFAFIVYHFKLDRKIYKHLFYGAVICSLGMLISFPIQGYGLFSILFTSLHLILSYIFVFFVFKDHKVFKDKFENLSGLFLKTSLVFMACSTLGTWMLGIIMGTGLKGSSLYYGSIQFFLHFQFNGWFIFAALAVLLKVLSNRGLTFERAELLKFYYFLTISCILTYALAVTWSTPDKFVFWINSAGVLLQFVALLYFLKIILSARTSIKSVFNKLTYFLASVAFCCFAFKILIQTLVAIPYFATISYTIKNFVIGFIHLLMLGGMSVILFAIYNQHNPLDNRTFKLGISSFLAGFVLSEALLFLQGLLLWMELGFLPGYYLTLFLFSLVMALGIFITGVSVYGTKISV